MKLLSLLALCSLLSAPCFAGFGFNEPKVAGLVAWWPLDENTGTVVNDKAGWKNTAYFTNSPAWTNNAIVGSAIYFNASGFIASPQNPLFTVSATNVSIAFWANIKSTSFAGAAKIIADDSNADSGAQKGLFIALDDRGSVGAGVTASNAVWMAVGTPGGNNSYLAQMTNAFDLGGAWYHYCISYNGTIMSIFRNGIQQTVTPSTTVNQTGDFVPRNSRFLIGDYQTTGIPITGFLDDVRIYNRALTADDVKRLYNGGHGSNH